MIRQVVSAAVLACVTMTAPAWCEQMTSARGGMNNKSFAMLGRFEPTASGFRGHTALAITYSWAAADRYATVEYTQSSTDVVVAAQPASVTSEAFTVIAGARKWQGGWYYGGGAGLSHLETDTLTPAGILSDKETNLAWEVLIGAPFGGRGLAELKYVDAGDDGARGFAAFVGVRY
ncbi:MAG: hypothetical protein JSV65_02625 [Armatimonadota bacterium]|nr:MAG: hypothetical protein JSV65_02625 [Armatimonadota bacterium]